ncbi:MAG: hypothetical protein KAU90_03965, partial [Sulfurovaceae bacterium]|nr:hypothetical protein [Sulfurovaceae bacterium]
MIQKNIFLLLFIFMGCSSITITQDKKIYSTYLNITNIKSLNFQHHNLALKYINSTWYYINKKGKAMSIILDEKGKPDSFTEGLARTKID